MRLRNKTIGDNDFQVWDVICCFAKKNKKVYSRLPSEFLNHEKIIWVDSFFVSHTVLMKKCIKRLKFLASTIQDDLNIAIRSTYPQMLR